MSRHLSVGLFDSDHDVLAAARAARSAGWPIVDVYSPHPIHGIDEAMGLPRSRLSLACLVGGIFGAAFILWFEIWTAAVDWPLNVGGKPFNSLPAFIPITFEMMVLFGGLSAVVALLVVARLRPGKAPPFSAAGVTDDRFALVLERTSAPMTAARVRAFLEAHRAVGIEERVVGGEDL
ncbi:MAG: DUF3341 domain-containing protein [Acidobacteria bacterium]|nr:DUF3341 domain-containing protein [Acidobacteriota bacterium]